MKTEELTGRALDWAVAKAEGIEDVIIHHGHVKIPIDSCAERYPKRGIGYKQYHPSTSWRLAGPIIDKAFIDIEYFRGDEAWQATIYLRDEYVEAHGDTARIAAMRCYVLAKLGPEINLPEELQ